MNVYEQYLIHANSYERRIYLFFRIGLGIIFVWASWDKIFNPADFAEIIKNYQILPLGLVNPVAVILPWVEIVCGILLIFGYMVKGASTIINVMMLVFIAAISMSIYKGLNISCGCFTLDPEANKGMWGYLFRDIFMLGVGCWVLFYRIKSDLLKLIMIRG